MTAVMAQNDHMAARRAKVRLACIVLLAAIAGGFALMFVAANAGAPHWVGFAINGAQLVGVGWSLMTLIKVLREQTDDER
jgi:hypothetical protein